MTFYLLLTANESAAYVPMRIDLMPYRYIHVNKHTRQAHLRSLPLRHENSAKIESYLIGSGKNAGDKHIEGDGKTPEGIYQVQERLYGPKLNYDRYGPLALTLNYPNYFDRVKQKTGSGIWLHGAGNNARMAAARSTDGCVIFENSKILELAELTDPYFTFVVITTNDGEVNQRDDIEQVLQASSAYLKSHKQFVFHRLRALSLKDQAVTVSLQFQNRILYGQRFLYWKKMSGRGWQLAYNELIELPKSIDLFERPTQTLPNLTRWNQPSMYQSPNRQARPQSNQRQLPQYQPRLNPMPISRRTIKNGWTL